MKKISQEDYPVGTPVACSLWGGKRIGIITGYPDNEDDDYVYVDKMMTFKGDVQYNLIKEEPPSFAFTSYEISTMNKLRKQYHERTKLTTVEKIIEFFDEHSKIPEVKTHGLSIKYIVDSLSGFLNDEIDELECVNGAGIRDHVFREYFLEKYKNGYTRAELKRKPNANSTSVRHSQLAHQC